MPSIMQRVGTPNARHNKDVKYRSQLENVDADLTKYNEVVREKSVEQIYAEHLQPAFEKYNEKQKRKDRRLDVKWKCSTALEYQRALDENARASKNVIDQKGRPPIREIVWQIGNPEQGYGSLGQTEESRQRIKNMLLECQAVAEKRYPQLAWGDVIFHADEVSQDADGKEMGSLHLHCDFVPLCYQNKQGPEVQVAMERCLREMGFSSFQDWKHDLDSIMEEVLERHGLERQIMNNHEKHQDSKEFHRQQRLIKETRELEKERALAQQEKLALESEIVTLEERKEVLQEIVDWPMYDAETNRAWNILDTYKKRVKDTFSSGWLFRNRKGERLLLDALEDVILKITAIVSAMRGFEKREQVEEEHQRSKALTKGLESLISDADSRRIAQQALSDQEPVKTIPGPSKDVEEVR